MKSVETSDDEIATLPSRRSSRACHFASVVSTMSRAGPRPRARARVVASLIASCAAFARLARADATSASSPHPYLSFDVSNINTDVSADFFADASAIGGSTDSAEYFKCRHGCVSSDAVTLEFCDERVQYTFCKRGSAATLAAGTSDQASVDLMEQALRKQYLNLIRQLTFEPTAGCRATLRRWFCFEYFSRCNVDETRFMPTCTATCIAVKKSCGEANSAFINCGLEYEEQDFGGNTPATFYTGGSYDGNGTYYNDAEGKANGNYIYGRKPNGENGTAIFEPSPGKCTGGAALASARVALFAATVFASFASIAA